ncbi:MAG: phosphotransferase family protein [Bacillota bacterium]
MHQPTLDEAVARWVLQSVGPESQISRVTPLAGATSSSLYRIGIEGRDRAYSVVLRLFTDNEWLRHEPDLALHEAASLGRAGEVSVPTPELIAFDEDGASCRTPAVLMTEVPGAVDLRPRDLDAWLDRMAEALVAVHRVAATTFPWTYRIYNDVRRLQPPAWSSLTDLWSEAIRLAQGPPPPVRPVFIHRDYHPVNVLWENDRLSGIVDWVNACRGPAGIDVGHCRLNLALVSGVDTANAFLAHYQARAGQRFDYHPYWDVLSMLEFLPGPPEVYRGWLDFGLTHLTPALVQQRLEDYLLSLVACWRG